MEYSAWKQTSSRSSHSTALTPEEATKQAGEVLDALVTLTTEIVSLTMIVQKALSVLLAAAEAEGYSR